MPQAAGDYQGSDGSINFRYLLSGPRNETDIKATMEA